MSEVEVNLQWRHRIEVVSRSRPRAGVRSWNAWRLRSLANRLDHSTTLSLRILSSHPIPQDEVRACLKQGIEQANALLTELAHQAACEQAMKTHFPELFIDQAEENMR